jgi:hypothetical protein
MKKKQILYDPWQIEFLATEGDKILCTGRQVGKSVTCGKDAGDYSVNNPDTEPVVMIAPTERQAYALFRKTLGYLIENFPDEIAKGKDRPTKERITLKSGVEIYCLPVGLNGLGIRFLTIGRLYVDEASRIPEDVWEAVTPALLTTGGDSIYLSTPFGAEGEFYNVWSNKDNAYNSFTRFSMDSEKAIRERKICETWTERQRNKALEKLGQYKARMTNSQYAQEFMGEFISGLKQFFQDNLIDLALVLDGPREATEDEEEFLGMDIARMGGDEGTFISVAQNQEDKELLEQTGQKIIQYERSTTTIQITKELNRVRDYKKIYIDTGAGGGGATVFDILLDDDETGRKVVSINNASASIEKYGTGTRRILKEDLYDNLLRLMELGKIKLIMSDEMRRSLRSIQFEYIKGGRRIYGNYTHLVEGLIRAAWCVKDKDLNIYIF